MSCVLSRLHGLLVSTVTFYTHTACPNKSKNALFVALGAGVEPAACGSSESYPSECVLLDLVFVHHPPHVCHLVEDGVSHLVVWQFAFLAEVDDEVLAHAAKVRL